VAIYGFLILSLVTTGITEPVVSATDGGSETTGPVTLENEHYQSIQRAIDEAEPGDTITVEPGTYNEVLVIDKSVNIVAPKGATLDGSPLHDGSVGITLTTDSAFGSQIRGFVITGYETGVNASDTSESWELRNVTISENEATGIEAERTEGSWLITESRITENGDDGIDTENSTGAFSLTSNVIRDNSADGFKAENTTGNWRIRSTNISSNGDDGIDADGTTSGDFELLNTTLFGNRNHGLDVTNTTGNWSIRRSVIAKNRVGVVAWGSHGDWLITSTEIRNQSDTGVLARYATGNWRITDTRIHSNRVTGVEATETTGDWILESVRISGSYAGVVASRSAGDWRISRTEIDDIRDAPFTYPPSGTAVYAVDASGAWTISSSNIMSVSKMGVNATGSIRTGSATGNWWSTDDLKSPRCSGNVDCGNSRSESVAVDPETAGEDSFGTVFFENRIALILGLGIVTLLLGSTTAMYRIKSTRGH